jgi:HEPN domain-containing protein
MPNKQLATEWLESGKKHLIAAEILLKSKHFNDIVGIEVQQAIERFLKAVLAYYNKPVLRTHDLSILLEEIRDVVNFDAGIKEICEFATDYYQETRYPERGRSFLPSDNEIERVLDGAHLILDKVNELINRK